MKVKKEFALRQVADTWAVLPMAKDVLSFDGMLTLNESGALLWQCLEKGCTREELADALTAAYDVARDRALADIDELLFKLNEAGCLIMD